MVTSFLHYIQKENLFKIDEKILLTVSGGIDSVLMCELFHKAGLSFGIAHCNFQLRAEESDTDEEFVEALAEKYDVPFHCTSFDTKAFAKKNKLSTQVAARELRYQWFEEIREQYQYQYIATAHHQDDSIETFFINFIRGTGISGLHGILPKQGIIIRPMLFTAKQEIETYVKKHKIKYREDSSNASDKYVRNKIRHQVIPVLKELNPSLENTFTTTIEHLRAVESIYKKDIESKRLKAVKQGETGITISIEQLKKLQPISTYLYEFLKPFHFNASTVNEIIAALDGESGKQYFSASHRLIKDRALLLIEPIVKNGAIEGESPRAFPIKKSQKAFINEELELNFKILKKSPDTVLQTPNTIAALDFDKLEFPLHVRKWQQGDAFHPLGMKGKKKLSDFFIDKKLSLKQKENTWLLTSADKIVWIIGLRMDERFKITEKTQKIYFVELV
ncbi:MAG: tRNA lysidine(34) synthetase TilS [Bacteroidota bacterium]